MTKDKNSDPIDLDESWARFTRRFGIQSKQPPLDADRQLPSPNLSHAPPPLKTSGTPWGIGVAGIVCFLLFFHVVPERMTVFPKASPSFANTFIDLPEYLKQYNSGSFIDQIAMRQTYLFQQLKAKGLIIEETGKKSD